MNANLYAVITKYTLDELEEEVNLALSKGWKCVGRCFVHNDKWCQTLVKRNKND